MDQAADGWPRGLYLSAIYGNVPRLGCSNGDTIYENRGDAGGWRGKGSRAGGAEVGEGDEFAGNPGAEAGIEGVLLHLLFENLLDHLVILHFRGNLHAEPVAALPALLRRDVEEVVAGGGCG